MKKNFIFSPPKVSVLYTGLLNPVMQSFNLESEHSLISVQPAAVIGFPVSPTWHVQTKLPGVFQQVVVFTSQLFTPPGEHSSLSTQPSHAVKFS